MAYNDGFGLNYDRGFGAGRAFMPDLGAYVNMYEAQNRAANAIQDRKLREIQGNQQYNLGLKGLDNQYDLGLRNLSQQRYATDIGAQLQREGYANQAAIANVQAEASKYPYTLKQQRWNQLWPFVQGMLANPAQWTSGYRGQGQVGEQPEINASPIYSGQQIQQQVNAMRAQNDAALASRQAQLSRELAGRGFGSRSPLALAMSQSLFGQNLAGNTAAEQALRWQAAQGNAQHLLAAQQAREGQFASRQQEEIERNKVAAGLFGQLLGSIFGAI